MLYYFSLSILSPHLPPPPSLTTGTSPKWFEVGPRVVENILSKSPSLM